MKILIVDDSSDDRKLLRCMVEKHGHQAVEAEDGFRGLWMAKSTMPDLIISDALMPRIDGFQFLRSVKKEPDLCAIPFVFYSASYKGEQDIRLAISLGADAYIIKPVDPVEMWEQIERVVAQRKKKTGDQQPAPLIREDVEYLKRYSEVVAAKLEEKVLELERILEERRQAEAYREMTLEILYILNEPGDMRDFIARVLSVLKTRTGFDVVGVRLQDGDDFPYFVQDGFSKDFLQTENTLIVRNEDGGLCRDKDGNIKLECTCGLVISGKTEPSSPLFTRGGSFWTNDSCILLDLPSDQDPRLHPRNECIHQGYASVALIPIRTKDRIVGLIQFNDRRKGRFSLDVVERLEGIALHIGEAMVRKQAEERIRQLVQHMETVREEERKRLARELHDDIGQTLTALKIDLLLVGDECPFNDKVKEKMSDMQKLLREGIQSIHSLCRRLRPGALDDLGLKEAVAGLVDDWKQRNKIECCFYADMEDAALSGSIRTAVFRIIQEALTNVSRYAHASKVEINLVSDEHTFNFSVADDGCGMESGADRKQTSFGLLGMHERMEALGGELHIESIPGKGTRIEGTVPLASV